MAASQNGIPLAEDSSNFARSPVWWPADNPPPRREDDECLPACLVRNFHEASRSVLRFAHFVRVRGRSGQPPLHMLRPMALGPGLPQLGHCRPSHQPGVPGTPSRPTHGSVDASARDGQARTRTRPSHTAERFRRAMKTAKGQQHDRRVRVLIDRLPSSHTTTDLTLREEKCHARR